MVVDSLGLILATNQQLMDRGGRVSKFNKRFSGLGI